MRTKLVACFLSVSLVVSLLSFPASAANVSSSSSIPENVAEIIASYFVDDYSTMPDSKWTTDTVIVDTVTMYDVDGAVSAYSFELGTYGVDTGYVVVSAYPDVEHVILEFSDSAEPIYEIFNVGTNDIVYTGGLNYYKEMENGELLTADGNTISKSSALTPLSDSRNSSFLPVQTRTISDPFAWAESYYDGTFSAVEWKNAFEDSCEFLTTTQFNVVNSVSYDNHCGPTAITNLIVLVGNYRNYAPVKNVSVSSIFSKVAQYGISHGYYSKATGTLTSTSNKYIKEAFASYNISTSVSTVPISYTNVKNAINSYKPLHLKVLSNSIYGDHSVVGYAYTVLENQYDDRISFVKIEDGWATSGRFLPIYTLSDDYMDVVSIGTLG